MRSFASEISAAENKTHDKTAIMRVIRKLAYYVTSTCYQYARFYGYYVTHVYRVKERGGRRSNNDGCLATYTKQYGWVVRAADRSWGRDVKDDPRILGNCLNDIN